MEDQIKKILEESKTEIQNTIVNKLKEDIINNYYWSLRDNVSTVVKEFFDEEIKDEMKKLLKDNKQLFIEQLQSGVVESAAGIAKKMVEVSTENLTGYKGKDIITKMFS
jgi:F420-0:gamma-glutamyl ligase